MSTIVYTVKYQPRFFGMSQENGEVKTLDKLLRDKSINRLRLAERMGVSRQTLGDWANGKKLPSMPNAAKLAEELDVTIAEVFALVGVQLPPRDTNTASASQNFETGSNYQQSQGDKHES
jgi:DNA-binding XRE family transcriptional regulator